MNGVFFQIRVGLEFFLFKQTGVLTHRMVWAGLGWVGLAGMGALKVCVGVCCR